MSLAAAALDSLNPHPPITTNGVIGTGQISGRLQQNNMTVGQLKEFIDKLDDKIAVVFVDELGDKVHTLEKIEVIEANYYEDEDNMTNPQIQQVLALHEEPTYYRLNTNHKE